METVTRVAKAMQEVLIHRANELAVKTEFVERDRKLTGSSFICGLVFGWQANPQSGLSGLSQAIGNAGTPLTRQGLAYRFDAKAVRFSRALLEESLQTLVKAEPIADGLLSRFSCVDVIDSSIITLPNCLRDVWQGSGGFGANASVAAVKLNVRWDVCSGTLKTIELSDGVQHDRKSIACQQAVRAGGLQIADLGYFKLDDFERIDRAGGFWLSRYKSGTVVYDSNGKRLNLSTWLPQRVGQSVDCQVLVGQKQLRCRLVAERVPPAVVRQRWERLRETARQNGKSPSAQSLEMAKWTIYITNVPLTLLTAPEVFILGRYRWQIELLFKLWKRDLQVDKWASDNPHRILCELYIKLIGAIVTHWLLLVSCWHEPQRSLVSALHTIRGLAWQLANSLHDTRLLHHAFKCLLRAVSCCKMGKSRADPRAWQLIHAMIA